MILVTGGAGYVGSHAVARLIEAGHAVVVLDNLTTGHRPAVSPRAELVVGDVRDQPLLRRVMTDHGVTAVMHFAAVSLVGDSMRQPLIYLDHNISGIHSVLSAMVAEGVPTLVFSSTAAVYGMPESSPIAESCPTDPGSPYGESKLACERIIRWACRIHGLHATCLRYFNAAGADATGLRGEDHRPETHLVPRILKTALGQYPNIKIFGTDYATPDGTCVRDYVHVDDLAAAHLAALDGAPGQFRALNLGNERGYSVREVIAAAKEVTGIDFPVIEAPRRPGDPATLVASAAAARQELGWGTASSDLSAILSSAWRWHRKHPDGFPS